VPIECSELCKLSFTSALNSLDPSVQRVLSARFLSYYSSIMSSRDSSYFPSARSKTTPEVEPAFFRAWSLRPSRSSNRSSDTAHSIEVSPRTSPAPTSSVGTVRKAQRRAKRPEHQRLRSAPAAGRLSDSGKKTPTTPLSPGLGGTHAKESTLGSQMSVGSLRSESTVLPASPNTSPLQRLVHLSSHCITPSTAGEPKPNHKAREGFNWKLEASGHWIEFKIGRKSQAAEPHKAPEGTPLETLSRPMSAFASPASLKVVALPEHHGDQHSTGPRLGTKKALAGTVQASTRSPPVSPGRYGVLTRWNKRRSSMKHGPEAHHPSKLIQTRSLTGHLLQRASSVLKDLKEKQRSSTSSASSTLSIAASYTRNAHLSPLYGGHSNTSSIRNVHIGKAPLGTPVTPDSDIMYLGSDSKQYFRVEISEPGAPTYLPSEARRIGTPPLPGEVGRHRGFFFDYNAPDDEGSTPNSERKEGGSPRSHLKRKDASDVDWYRAKMEADEARDAAMNFELNVPDHLPGSPLCPKHPKHKSGGKGICVYHGRNRNPGDDP